VTKTLPVFSRREPDEFVALPVGTGDAFFLRRAGRTCLVDGGMSESGFPTTFSDHLGTTHIDVMICTHNDADHVRGLIGYLAAGKIAGELWLPADWAPALERLGDTADLVFTLAKEWRRDPAYPLLRLSPDHYPSFEELGELVADEVLEHTTETVYVDESGLPPRVTSSFERPDANPLRSLGLIHHVGEAVLVNEEGTQWVLPGEAVKPVIDAVAAALAIAALAKAAYASGVPIRWFEYGPTAPSVLSHGIQPVNSKPVLQLRRPSASVSLFRYLALTRVNRRSLVFWSPPHAAAPGVLFCADSDLARVSLPPAAEMGAAIVTAPHHGADANRAVYDLIEGHLAAAASDLAWVRSDRVVKARPCGRFKKVLGRRYCTVCNHPSVPLMAVKLVAADGVWRAHDGCHECNCK
jgi:hypothetical protein